jgi:hypothetical protein
MLRAVYSGADPSPAALIWNKAIWREMCSLISRHHEPCRNPRPRRRSEAASVSKSCAAP